MNVSLNLTKDVFELDLSSLLFLVRLAGFVGFCADCARAFAAPSSWMNEYM